MARLVGGLLACLMLAAPARADLPPEVSIRWSGACPRPFALEAEVSQLLGGKRPQLPATEFEVDVDEEGAGYELTLDVKSSESRAERTVQLATCQEAQDAAVLLIATAIDPEAVLRVQKPPPPPPPPEPPKPPRPRAPPYRWSLTLRGLFDLSSLPGPTGGPTVGGLWQAGSWRAWVDLRYLVGRSTEKEDVRARLDLFAAALGGAYVWAWDPFVFGPAVELEAGALRARDIRGLQRAKNDSAPWGSVQLGALAAWRATERFGLELSMFAGVPLRHPALAARDAEPFYTTGPATIRLALGARVSLGSP